MSEYQWETTFLDLFERCLDRYRGGDRDFEGYYSSEDLAFLESIGYKKREFFDFVEDYAEHGVPSPAAAVLIADVRRNFRRHVMGGKASANTVRPSDLPGRGEELGGFAWLPRIIVKARGKLRGALDPDIMYGCGGDRAFLERHGIAPADFLRVVWSAGDDEREILAYVKSRSPEGA